MKERHNYVVYRAYSEKERPGLPLNERTVLYGWTTSKNIIKAFFDQRDKKKYKVVKLTDEDMARHFDDEMDPTYIIDFIELKSSSTGDNVILFMTHNELKQAEVNIHQIFRDLSRLVERDDGKTRLLEMYINLDDRYLDPLQYLGFKPPELEDLYDSVEYIESDDPMYEIEGLINSAYNDIYDVPHDVIYHTGKIPGLLVMDSVSDKILYSAESFIKVLKNDM